MCCRIVVGLGGIDGAGLDRAKQHYNVPINYVGHAESWDEIVTEGDIMRKDCVLRFKRNGRISGVASIFRDLESREAEVLMECATAP